MNIIDGISKGMEKINTNGFVPEGCLLCEFCDLYQPEKKTFMVRRPLNICPAGEDHIMVKATVLGTKGDFVHAYCQALNQAVLISVWNYTQDMVQSPEGAVHFLEDLANYKESGDMQHTPSTDTLDLGVGFADEVKRSWNIMMAYQTSKRAVTKNWWVERKKNAYQHLENPFGNNVKKVVKEHSRPQDDIPFERRMKYIIKEFIVFKEKYAELARAAQQLRSELKSRKGVQGKAEQLEKENRDLKKENEKLKNDLVKVKKAIAQIVS